MSELRKRGLSTAVICTEPFLRLGQAQAKVFGVPDLPLVLIPHPLGGISLEQVHGRAEYALQQILDLLKGKTT
jgi:hypothetical protein